MRVVCGQTGRVLVKLVDRRHCRDGRGAVAAGALARWRAERAGAEALLPPLKPSSAARLGASI